MNPDNPSFRTEQDETIRRLSTELSAANLKIKEYEFELNAKQRPLGEQVLQLTNELAESRNREQKLVKALEIYRDKSNWSYWSNHDVGAFKEEWTMWKQNCRGPEIAEECLAKIKGNDNR